MTRVRYLFIAIAASFVLGAIAFGIWVAQLDSSIRTRFAEKRFAPPVEFYSAPETIRPGMKFPARFFENHFARKNFRLRDFGQPLQPGDYSLWTREECLSLIQDLNSEEIDFNRCIGFRSSTASPTDELSPVPILALDAQERVVGIYAAPTFQSIASAELEPELFAQYYGNQPVLRHIVNLGDIPTHCLNGLLAIEDAKFLEHRGVSITGLIRAIMTVLTPGQRAQGGSTITQQLVKNYFLTDERTFRRKAVEMVMAVIVEQRASKDDILETYANLIYMGQNGPFQVRGLAAASEHYFGKHISDLNLDQCALLVGVLNNPGHFNPFTAPERAERRRTRVLDRMEELGFISSEQSTMAKSAPLPQKPQRNLTEPAPYFVQAIRRHIHTLGIDESEGLKVFTTLNLRAQEAAHRAVREGLDRIEATYKQIKELKAKGKSLEASLIAAHPETGAVEAMVGGRGYLLTQFNRAVDSQRQVGSVMKPFVYLAALETLTPEGTPYSPLTRIPDRSITHRFEGQTWAPRNYDGTLNGDVPLYWALQESLNVATANLGVSVGLGNVIDTSRRLGLTSKITALPSLTLGAFELTPYEVLQAYASLAQLGKKMPLTTIRRIENLSGTELYTHELESEVVTNTEATAELVGIMKQIVSHGTGRAVQRLGFTHPAAGKTGTTNDKKDAWFAGFTPYHASVVWVGYDDNTPHDLTGASGAVPIWTTYMKNYAATFPADDFSWPESVEKVLFSPEDQLDAGVPERKKASLTPIELILRR